jgi:type IV pilus assembly protein PilQ
MMWKKNLLVVLAIVSLLCCWTVSVSAADSPKKDEQTPVSEAQKKLQKIVSVNFKDTSIDEAINFLSEAAGVDIIKSPQVSGTVTATISDAPLGEVLENILALNNAGFVVTDKVIRVVPKAEMQQQKEVRISKIYRVTYADVKQVSDALKAFVSKDAEIAVNSGSSNIIVTDTEAKIKAIDSFLEEVDRQTPQILVEVRIYDISSQNTLDLGINWNIGTNTSFDATSNAASGGRTDPFVLGGNTSTKDIASGTGAFRFGWLNNSIDIDVLLRAEQEDVSANLLANPRILVLDNEKANFKSIEQIPYQELQQTSSGGSIGTTSFKEVGVMLEVTPHVTRDQMLRLRIVPEFSTATRTVNVAAAGSPGFPQPVIDTRKADTTLLIPNGKTVVLGGLRKKETNKRINKIPLLGDIPLLGAIFRSTSEKVVTRELVVFLTPKIVAADQPVLSDREKRQVETTDTQLNTPPKMEKPVVEGGNIVGKPDDLSK